MSIVVRPGSEADIDSVVAVHQQAFPRLLTTRLGPLVLRDYYRQALLPDSAMALWVAEDDATLAGFAAVLTAPDRFYRRYRRRRLRVLVLALPRLITMPGSFPSILGALARARQSATAPPGGAELSSIATRPDQQGRGVGTRLMAAVREHLAGGSTVLYLWTDAQDNAATLSFYRRLGFRLESERSFDGRRSVVRLSLALNSSADQTGATA